MHSQTSILSNSQRSEESRENWPIQQLAVIWNTCRWKQCRLPVGFNYKSALWAACINSSFKRISALSLKTGTTSTEHSLQQTFSAPCANPTKSSSRMVLDFFLFLTCVSYIHVFSVQKGGKQIGGVEKALTYLTLILEACVDLSPGNSYFYLFIYCKVFHLTCCLLISHLLLGEIKTVYERWM